MTLYICSTYYHVYITLLKLFSCHESQKIDLVICDDIPNGKLLSDRIRKTSLFSNVWFIRQREFPTTDSKNLIDAIISQHRRRAAAIRPMLPFSVHDYEDIYIYHDGTALGSYLNDEKCSYHLIEDALNFYQYVYQSSQAQLMYPHNFRYKMRKLLRAGYFPLGESIYILDIEVNEKSNLQIPSTKVIEKPRAELEQVLTPDRVQKLYEIFGYTWTSSLEAYKAIILTEPLYQDNFCSTQEEHHQIYRSITDFLCSKGFSVYIKPHPRDDTDYTSYPAVVIERYFPSELFKLQGNASFDCAVAVASSSLINFPAKDRYYWDIQRNTFKDSR